MVNFYTYDEQELSLFQQEIDIYEKEKLDRADANKKAREARRPNKERP